MLWKTFGKKILYILSIVFNLNFLQVEVLGYFLDFSFNLLILHQLFNFIITNPFNLKIFEIFILSYVIALVIENPRLDPKERLTLLLFTN